MTRDDVIRITENILSELTIEVDDGDWTNPNSRVILLKLGEKILTSAYFNVVQRDEYEG